MPVFPHFPYAKLCYGKCMAIKILEFLNQNVLPATTKKKNDLWGKLREKCNLFKCNTGENGKFKRRLHYNSWKKQFFFSSIDADNKHQKYLCFFPQLFHSNYSPFHLVNGFQVHFFHQMQYLVPFYDKKWSEFYIQTKYSWCHELNDELHTTDIHHRCHRFWTEIIKN